MNWQMLADAVAWFYLAYFAVLGVFSFLLHACSLLEVPRQLEVGLPELLPRPHSGYEPPVSLIVPLDWSVANTWSRLRTPTAPLAYSAGSTSDWVREPPGR